MIWNNKNWIVQFFTALICLMLIFSVAEAGNNRDANGRIKVLYHIDGSDVGVAKYAMALINKHMEAEGGPDKIDIKEVVHGSALKLFIKETVTRNVPGFDEVVWQTSGYFGAGFYPD